MGDKKFVMPETKNYAFTQHKKCEWFPCHKGIPEEDFNCLFCFCPLYALGTECGGNYSYDNKKGIKDCSNCIVPHHRDSYDHIVKKTKILVERSKQDLEKSGKK